MFVFFIKENITRNVMIPILSALFLFLSGILIINWQLWQMEKLSYTSLPGNGVLIIPQTKGLMAKVVTQLKPLLPKLPDGFHIGVNISARHINVPSFIGDCRVFGKGFQGKEVKLVLEVTEREPLIDNPHLVENLNMLHNAGFVIALDDFGTGCSGLSCLNALAIDYIKIDKSFVNRVSDEKDSTILLDCVIDLAKKLSLRIVAEGVETKAQLEYLNRNEITLLQGYYFGKPVSCIDFIKVILSKPRETVSL